MVLGLPPTQAEFSFPGKAFAQGLPKLVSEKFLYLIVSPQL